MEENGRAISEARQNRLEKMGTRAFTAQAEETLSLRKALVISLKPGMDMSDVVQIAKSEGKRLFHGHTVCVDEILQSKHGDQVIVVVQSLETPKRIERN
jgi:5-formyltetrahydrofolate cyclo-ligase